MKKTHPAVWLLPAAMLVIALFPWPYGYYQLLRVVVFGCAAFLSWKSFEAGGKKVDQLTLTFGAMALLMNPFLPIELPRAIWMVANLICAGLFLASFVKLFRPTT
jgi:hypothetical protein